MWRALFGCPCAAAVRDAPDVKGRTPAFLAAFGGRVECLGELLAAGAVLGMADAQGRTALHAAAYARRTHCLDMMAGPSPLLAFAHNAT